MSIYTRGDWLYDLDVSAFEGKFLWNVVRLKIDHARLTQIAVGTWVAGGISMKRDEAEREGLAAIAEDFQQFAGQPG